MEIQAVIFDLDGVITDTAKYHFLAWKKLCDELGFHFDQNDNERLKGVSRMDSFEIILQINNAENRFTQQEKERFIQKKNDYYVDFIRQVTPADILGGISEFIEKAKAKGMKLAVASVSKNAPAVLSSLQIIDKFDYIADATKITKSKPDPEIFAVCAKELGVPPERCVGIEDAQAGIEAIKAAGMFAVGINVTVTSAEPDLHLQATSQLDLERLLAL